MRFDVRRRTQNEDPLATDCSSHIAVPDAFRRRVANANSPTFWEGSGVDRQAGGSKRRGSRRHARTVVSPLAHKSKADHGGGAGSFSAGGIHLGALYQNGTLVPRDATQAIAWYKLAAEHGCPAAYNALARPYAELGVTNHESEYFWTVVATRAASSEGKTSSPESLTGLRTSISAEDAQRIEAEAEQWMQKHPIALPAFDLFELPEDSVVARVK